MGLLRELARNKSHKEEHLMIELWNKQEGISKRQAKKLITQAKKQSKIKKSAKLKDREEGQMMTEALQEQINNA